MPYDKSKTLFSFCRSSKSFALNSFDLWSATLEWQDRYDNGDMERDETDRDDGVAAPP